MVCLLSYTQKQFIHTELSGMDLEFGSWKTVHVMQAAMDSRQH